MHELREYCHAAEGIAVTSTAGAHRGIEMYPGDHICALYDGGQARDELVLSFVQSGLDSGDKYDLDAFGGGILVDLMKTHPKLLLGGMLLENPHALSPDEFLAER
jgi:hypothetical protein